MKQAFHKIFPQLDLFFEWCYNFISHKWSAGTWRAGFVLKEGPFVKVAPAVWNYETYQERSVSLWLQAL
ncbi:hypothetical protein D3OALGA1CA_2919 [Olavius algarvensis associated proteobacterium Delta 3]|nr:hypothetical protein D3OALGB2SA_2752 [Olavius algarvensis associated proteobacterium Delta 3]CAB5126239.1 hypothetical protein D3OALGA1CA_2919 [Olavius algarvensis associated proteobacterium Delta 3]